MSTLSVTKIVSYDTRINYRLVQFFQFFSQKLFLYFSFMDSYYKDILDSVNTNVGHNKTHYELFLQTQTLVQTLETVTTTYVETNPSIYDETPYLSAVNNVMEECLLSFSQYVHNFSVLWLQSRIYNYGDDYSITETDSYIDTCSKERGIINIMNTRQLSITFNIINVLVKIIEQSNNYYSSLFQKLDKNNDNISQITQVLFPQLTETLEQIVYYTYFSSIDFNIITLNRENILSTDINKDFSEKMITLSEKIIEMKDIVLNIFSLI